MPEDSESFASSRTNQGNMLDIKIKNFGPITEGRISLRPMTVLIGPNGSGKSYVAALAYSITNQRDHFYKMSDKVVRQIIEECKAAHKRGERELDLPTHLVSEINKAVTKEIEMHLKLHLGNSFTQSPNSLVQTGSSIASVEVKSGELNADVQLTDAVPTFTIQDCISSIKVTLGSQGNVSAIQRGKHMTIDNLDTEDRDKKSSFAFLLHRLPLLTTIPTSIYFPAERSGLLRTYKIVLPALLEHALRARSMRKNPAFPPFATDFLKILVRMEKSMGRYADIADELEQETMRGNLEAGSEDGMPEIRYRYKGQSMPVGAASSSILELGPITLCLKHTVEPENLLIIEEPESNLDLENQRILAKFLVRLIRNDLRIMITTHSPFMLEQLSNFLQAAAIPGSERMEMGYEENDYLKIDEVAAYSLEPDSSSGYYKIQPIQTTRNGISQEYFIKSNDLMYEESYRLEKKLSEG